MRKIVAFDRVSADGYFSDLEGSLDWTVPEPELDKEAASGLSGSGSILFGRRTYEVFESFWPHALDDSGTAPDPHSAGRRSPEMRAMADWINAAEKLVFSRKRKQFTWRNSKVLRQIDPAEVHALKTRSGPDMLIFGSGSVVSQLTEHGLVDEYQLVVGPILLGAGRPLVAGLPKAARLDLLEAKAYPSGNVMLRYASRK